MREKAISIRGLKKNYSTGAVDVQALRGIDMDVWRGEFVCIAGKSGSGKSTLLNLVAGLESPSEGSIEVLGRRIDSMNETERIRFRRSNIGFVFQSYRLLPQYTAIENIALPLMLRGIDKHEREKRAMEALEMVGIAKCAHQRPAQMSGGEQQRAGIARSIITEPAIVMADEPTGNLDPKNSIEIMKLLEEINRRGTTVVVVTHNREIVNAMKKRVVRLRKGVIISDEKEGVYVED